MNIMQQHQISGSSSPDSKKSLNKINRPAISKDREKSKK